MNEEQLQNAPEAPIEATGKEVESEDDKEAKAIIGTHFRAAAILAAMGNDVAPIIEARNRVLADPYTALFATKHNLLPPDFSKSAKATNHCADCRQVISAKRLRCMAHFTKFTNDYRANMEKQKLAQAGLVAPGGVVAA